MSTKTSFPQDTPQPVQTIEKPHAALVRTDFPQALTKEPRWVIWREVQRGGKATKVLYRAQQPSMPASSADATTWTTFENALASCQANGFDGVGFVLGDGFAGVDLDDCRDTTTGELAPWAQQVIDRLHSYAEVSPSGAGVKVFVKGAVSKAHKGARIEIYGGGRYFTVTGRRINDLGIEARSAEIESLLKDAADARDFLEWARRLKHDKVHPLWQGQSSSYPSQSEADLALCFYLVRYCDGDGKRMDRLFRLSGLFREKWLRDDYRVSTVEKVQKGLLDEVRSAPPAEAQSDKFTAFRLTELGNAKRLVLFHGDDIRFCTQLGAWYVWDGRRWARDTTAEIMRRAKDTVCQAYEFAAKRNDSNDRKKIAEYAMQSESQRALNSMVSLAESEADVVVTAAMFDRDPYLLACLNGTLDLRTGELRPSRREDLITKLCPVEYDPNATSELWDTTLEWAIPNLDVRAFFQRAIGATIAGGAREDKLFFVHGPTASGKSTILEALKATLGECAVTADFETFLRRRDVGGPRNDIARLAGARMVLSSEVEEGRRLAEGLVKSLTGGDTMTARFLYQESFEFRPTFVLWLVANHAPRVADDDDALWRRIVRIPFNHTLPKDKRNPHVKATLRDAATSGPAILAWAVQGCLQWQQEGLDIPSEIEAATDAYRSSMDPLIDFWSSFVFAPDAWISAADLRKTYERWSHERGETQLLRPEQFAERLRSRGCEIERRHAGRGWRGLGLLVESL